MPFGLQGVRAGFEPFSEASPNAPETSDHTAQNRRVRAKRVSDIISAPSFSPYRPNFTTISLFAIWIDWMALSRA